MKESYQLPDGRLFDNQRDAEIAAGALGRCEWTDVTTWGSEAYHYVLKKIVPVPPFGLLKPSANDAAQDYVTVRSELEALKVNYQRLVQAIDDMPSDISALVWARLGALLVKESSADKSS